MKALSEIIVYMQANNLPCHNFLNSHRRHETPVLEENSYCSQECRQQELSVYIHSSCPSSLTGSVLMWAHMDATHRVGLYIAE